jgi:acyl CoA:acetate/3-ketoacid CoA transferase beta subunit
MQVAFLARVSGFEKLGVSASDVADAVRDNAFVLPGIGKPRVTVQDVSGGFKVTVRYPDSRSGIGSSAARRAIESIDPRLSGRIQNVAVARTVHA